MITKTQILERERRFTLIAGIAAVAGVALIIATFGSSAAGVRAAAGLAERLTEVDGDRMKLVLASIGQMIGWSLLAVPLVFMFKAAAARSTRVRAGLIGVIIAAPIFLGVGGLLSAGSVLQAASDYKALPATAINDCVNGKTSDAAKAGTSEAGKAVTTKTGTGTAAGLTPAQINTFKMECADEQAREVRADTSLAPIETAVGLAGLFGFTISVVYVSLWSMRTGLLTRFWGSLGLALGAVFVFFTLFTLVWFIYLGLLLAGWVPGGRPPAWAAGKAVEPPRPTGRFGGGAHPSGPAETENGPVDKWGEPIDEDVIDGTAESLPPGEGPIEAPEPGTAAEPGDPTGNGTGERRKRKRRNG